MPVDVFRRVNGIQVNVPTPPVLVNPGGEYVGIQEWLYSSQIDLDRVGNCFGIISERDELGYPRRIDLVDHRTVVVKVNKQSGIVTYAIDGTTYARSDIWHERQFTVSGMVMGLSPVGYAAWAIAQGQSALDFALEWFANGASVPGGHFKNTAKTILPAEAGVIKDRFKAAVTGRDVLVTGNDWEYSTVSTVANESQFLETQSVSATDIVRYFGAPGDLIDVATASKSAVTYASITQRNLQFLIMNIGPAFARREVALSKILPDPRYVKFATDAMLRMDPGARNAMMLAQVAGKIRAPSEVRELDNLPPFTPAQLQEFKDLGSTAQPAPEPISDKSGETE